ncbi:hypothetical protein [Cohnella zeiphila]|uniref:Uncharacterized protein n=1 Tax=Cohnella zeiphila TaxID=2761120 RepID=A0A7X0SQ69_9BACL|nr:hypothetical protein [Cohnella zeiphila]MBB6731868.1 hypothetical protein [Cohnella zeiphila]
MRQILMTVLLIMTVVLIYMSVVKGSGGTNEQIRNSGSAMAEAISRINP